MPYVVIENTPGCLPESDPAEFHTKKEAREHAVSLVSELRALGYRVRGNQKNGFWYAERDRNDPGRVVEILEAE